MFRSVFASVTGACVLLSVPVMAVAAEKTTLSPDQAADRLVWIDEHARWNAQHMAAARKLEAVVAALKGHETGFDLHEREVRAHGTAAGDKDVTSAHPRLRTAHEQARNVHDDLIDAVDALTRILRKNLGKNQSFPEALDLP